jgi:putative ABC transport system ATP-binding protein
MKIVIHVPVGETKEIDLHPGTYSLGRANENDLILNDTQASRKHAKIVFNPGQGVFVIEDLQSVNGVYVNKKRIQEREDLKNGDIIKLGETTIEVKSPLGPATKEDETKVVGFGALYDETRMIRPLGVVALEKASKTYHLGKVEVKALKDVDLQVQEGEFISVCGPSGSGKSTLLNLIGCIDTATSGKVSVQGKDVTEFSDATLSKMRNRIIGFIFQSFNLIPVLTAFENVEYPLVLQDVPKNKRFEMVATMMKEVGLADFVKHKPDELSGGQRQRVAIARALVTGPKIVLADEPTANLDSKTGIEILDLMQRMNEEHRTTFIFSTHDPKIEKYAKKIYAMVDGKLSL